MPKKLIVFDMDDVLWDLNDKASKMTGISLSKLTTFSVLENQNLTENEKQSMLATYHDTNLYKDIVFKDDIVNLVNQLHRCDDCDVKIISNCVSQEVADLKRQQLHNVLELSDKDIILHVIHIQDSKKKALPSGIHLFIDDSPHNIALSGAMHCIMPAKQWNNVLIDGCLNGIYVERPSSDKELYNIVMKYV